MVVLNGFVKIHRKLIQWGWYQDNVVKGVFLHLLLTANFKDTAWQGRVIKTGQVIVGTQKMADELGFTRQQIRTALNKLKSTKEITTETTNKYTIVTIVNWEDYQYLEEVTTNKITNNVTNEQPTNNQQITNNQPQRKKEKNVKKDKNKTIEDILNEYSENEALKNTVSNFIEMRKNIKAPMTENALNLLLKKLDSMVDNDLSKIEILEQSILNSWKSIYELKAQNKEKTIAPKSKFNNFQQDQKYDFAEIERQEQEKIMRRVGM